MAFRPSTTPKLFIDLPLTRRIPSPPIFSMSRDILSTVTTIMVPREGIPLDRLNVTKREARFSIDGKVPVRAIQISDLKDIWKGFKSWNFLSHFFIFSPFLSLYILMYVFLFSTQGWRDQNNVTLTESWQKKWQIQSIIGMMSYWRHFDFLVLLGFCVWSNYSIIYYVTKMWQIPQLILKNNHLLHF